MSVWNQVLQALHSALIDELNSRFPDDKLELGLPKRFDGWAPSPSSEAFLYRKILSSEGTGIATLGTLRNQDASETKEIWSAAHDRTMREFSLRKIDARFGESIDEPGKLSMTIWLPMRIPTMTANPVYDLAVGI